MPNATAPNAPCVDVWLSPQAIVIPGCVRPSSGPMTWTMPWRSSSRPASRMPKSRQLRSSDADHVLGHDVEERPRPLARRDDVIDRGERAIRARHLPAARAQRVERLRSRHLVHEVQPDEQLRLPRRQRANRVEIPHLLEESFAHFASDRSDRRLESFGDVRIVPFESFTFESFRAIVASDSSLTSLTLEHWNVRRFERSERSERLERSERRRPDGR